MTASCRFLCRWKLRPATATLAGAAGTGSGAFRRNIFSMRPVTTYPPTTLAAAKSEATNASR